MIDAGAVVVAARPREPGAGAVYPAAFPGVIAVSSAATDLAASGLAAPGDRIIVALPDDDYDFRSGSSLAAANLSGVAALLLEHSPGLSADALLAVLQRSQRHDRSGRITINACHALAELGVDNECR